MADIPEDRALTGEEEALVRWMLENGTRAAAKYRSQVSGIRVVARCGCGCASIDFSLDGVTGSVQAGMSILSDWQWRSAEGHVYGAFLFAREGQLAGLDVYSVDGGGPNERLPLISELQSGVFQ